MRSEIINSKPLIFAHRGASGIAVENSTTAFQKAINCGADGLETDAWIMNDGKIVLHHDEYIVDSNNKTIKIPKSSLSEIKKLSLSNGDRILTITEFLERFANKKTKSNKKIQFSIDLQNLNAGEKIVQILQEFDVIDQTILCATSYTALNRVRKLNKEIRLNLTHREDLIFPIMFQNEDKWSKINPYAFNIQAEILTDEIMKNLRDNSFKVFIWDLHTKELLKKYLKFNPEAIYTNFPSIANEIWR
ncbi:MAG: glycerophosphodiester phosphodiesterase, partial [Promethearchaeota archaeon]